MAGPFTFLILFQHLCYGLNSSEHICVIRVEGNFIFEPIGVEDVLRNLMDSCPLVSRDQVILMKYKLLRLFKYHF